MRFTQIVLAVVTLASASAPAFAADSMMAGKMSMMKMAKPINCIMIMTGKDGKTYMVTPTTKAEMAECDKMAM